MRLIRLIDFKKVFSDYWTFYVYPSLSLRKKLEGPRFHGYFLASRRKSWPPISKDFVCIFSNIADFQSHEEAVRLFF